MQSRPSPLIEAFLILEQPRQRLSHWIKALAPLDAERAPPLALVTSYYDPSLDQALLGLRYDEMALGGDRLAFVMEIALLAEIGMIQPGELSEGDRRRFLNQRLARCTIHVADQRNIRGSITELVRRVRDQKQAAPGTEADAAQAGPVRATPVGALPLRPPAAPPSSPAVRATTRPRGTTRDPVLLVQPKSTRDLAQQARELRRPTLVRGTRDPISRVVIEDPAVAQAAKPPTTPPGLRTHMPTVVERPVRKEVVRLISPNVISRTPAIHRAETVAVSAGVSPGQSADAPRDEPRRRSRSPSKFGTEPYLPTATGPLPPGIIYARYLRGGRWVPIRIGALSLNGATLMAGALPRLHDTVDIALSFGDHKALVRGPVSKVSSAEEAAMSGTTTFTVKFDLDDASRRQLTTLLTAARAANITIKPPPARQARRFPVEWPLSLGTVRGAVRADALDVSRDGMFVRPTHALSIDTLLNFSAVLDDGGAPVSGRARVVRHVSEVDARACGLAPGYGLLLEEMGDADRLRWDEFLARIEKRAEKRVLIGASPSRLAELQGALAAAGYAVSGGSDPGALVQLANTEMRPVDAALIDHGWLSSDMPATWAESLFSARNVPFVTVHGDARRARATIDKLLAVV